MEDLEILEIERKKRSLKRYKKNNACIERLEDRLIALVTRIESVGSPVISDMPRGGSRKTKEDLIAEKIELEERIARLKVKSKDLKREILEEIDSTGDPRYIEVLELFFIQDMSIEDIAEEVGYGPRHVQRLYSEGITLLALGPR